MNKYLNEAIIGNSRILATFSYKGEMLRLSYPNCDNRQYLNYFHTGVKVNDSNIIYLHDDINNTYLQYYDVDTNILNTEITNTYFNLKIVQTDFVSIKEDILIKKYSFINESHIEQNINFLIHSELLSDQNNFVSGMELDNGMVQFAHDFSVATFAKSDKLLSCQINNSQSNIATGIIGGKDYIGMSKDSSISFDIGLIHPGERKDIEICIYIDEKKTMNEFIDEVERIKKIDLNKEYNDVKAYWRKYVKEHDGLKIGEPQSSYDEKIIQIYKRSILLFPLLTNFETGGIIAAAEVDENLTQCGRYAYCWPRDAVFMTKALDILKMNDISDKFYNKFCKMTQSKNGMWEQRFYTDGKLAPSWGYQVDETASVVYGVYNHYEYTSNEEFLKDNLHMCELAITFLKKYVKDIFEQTNRYKVSYDIWEENDKGVHFYSLAGIIAAFESMKKIYKVLGKNVSDFENNRLKDEKINKNINEITELQVEIKKYIEDNLYDENRKSYVRNTEDRRMDISLLGAVYPFNIYSPKEKRILNTVDNINLTLRTYTGGYQRYEFDNYRKGSPWPISNLWMTLYYLELGEKKKAKETFDFVLNTIGKHSLLGEQIDNSTLKPNWVIGLGWSHAMFIIVLEKLLKQ